MIPLVADGKGVALAKNHGVEVHCSVALGVSDGRITHGLGVSGGSKVSQGLGVSDSRITHGLGVSGNKVSPGLGVSDNNISPGLGVSVNAMVTAAVAPPGRLVAPACRVAVSEPHPGRADAVAACAIKVVKRQVGLVCDEALSRRTSSTIRMSNGAMTSDRSSAL